MAVTGTEAVERYYKGRNGYSAVVFIKHHVLHLKLWPVSHQGSNLGAVFLP